MSEDAVDGRLAPHPTGPVDRVAAPNFGAGLAYAAVQISARRQCAPTGPRPTRTGQGDPHTLIVLEVLLLVAGLLALFTVVGLGLVVLLAPDCGGSELFIAPLVGLAVLYFASQWLSPHFASGPVIVTTCVIFGVFSLIVVGVRWRSVVSRASSARVDLAILAAFALIFPLLLQLPILHTGTLTLADFSGDDLFTWAPSAAYMQTHAYAAPHATAYVSPLLWLLPTNVYPGSVGTVDGGLLTVFGLHSYQLVDVLTAVCLSLGACVVYLLLRSALGTSRIIAGVGLILIGTNQSRFFLSGFGLAQAARGTALMLAVILLLILAFTKRSIGLAVLAGGITAVLAGLYMPAFLIALAASAGVLIAVLVPAFRDASRVAWRVVGAFVASGIVFGIQNIRWLLLDGGLHAWVLQTGYGRALFFTQYPFQYLAGLAPFQYVYRVRGFAPFAAVKPLFWSQLLSDVAIVVAIAAIVLVVFGAARLMARRNMVAAAALIFPLLYGAGVFIDNRGGFGSVLSVIYLMPIVCVLAAYGIDRVVQRVRTPREARHASAGRSRFIGVGTVALSCVVGIIVLFQVGSSAEDEAFFVHQPGMLSTTNLKLASIASVVPKGASILMYASDGSNGYAPVAKTQALVGAANFLPDREITIDGLYFTGTYGPPDGKSIKSALDLSYRYILHYDDPTIHDPKVPSNYHEVWRFPQDRLVLYERDTA
jgi:hypothetical protein